MSNEKNETGKPDKPDKPEKLKVVVNYGGREEKFSVKDGQTVRELRDKAMDEFGIHSGREDLALFKLDNTILEDPDPVAKYNLAEGETLILRQRRTGGG